MFEIQSPLRIYNVNLELLLYLLFYHYPIFHLKILYTHTYIYVCICVCVFMLYIHIYIYIYIYIMTRLEMLLLLYQSIRLSALGNHLWQQGWKETQSLLMETGNIKDVTFGKQTSDFDGLPKSPWWRPQCFEGTNRC